MNPVTPGATTPSDRLDGVDWREFVIVVAATGWDSIRMCEHHIARHLAKTTPVLWVDPPISWLTPLRNRAVLNELRQPRLRMAAPNILRLTPVTVPGVTRRGLRELALRQTRRAVRRTVAHLGGRVRATIVASLEDMLDVVPADQAVFYGTDDYVAGAELMGVDAEWLRRCEGRQLAKADTVIAISPVLAEKWSAAEGKLQVIPNGCDADSYAAAADGTAERPTDVRLRGPIAGFIGHLSERIDLDLLEAVAERGISLLLVGPRQPTYELGRMESLLARRNVQWVGRKQFEELPGYLSVIDVGLTPYVDSAFNRASVPLKSLEYLAGGRPVVSSDLPANAVLGLTGANAPAGALTVARTPAEFADATERLLTAGRTPEQTAAYRELGAANSWASRGEQISALLGLPLAPAR